MHFSSLFWKLMLNLTFDRWQYFEKWPMKSDFIENFRKRLVYRCDDPLQISRQLLNPISIELFGVIWYWGGGSKVPALHKTTKEYRFGIKIDDYRGALDLPEKLVRTL